jgi:hypothetical protein
MVSWSRLNRIALVLCVALMLSAAAANVFASDADILVTDPRGVIVGVGRLEVGASFELRLLAGFRGPAQLTLLHRDGSTETLAIWVDVSITYEGRDLLDLILGRFDVFTVELDGVPWPDPGRRADHGAETSEGDALPEPPVPQPDRRPGEGAPVDPPAPPTPVRP